MELEPLMISFDRAAELLGIGRSMLYSMRSDGRLGVEVHKIGRRTLINYQELKSWSIAGMPPREIWQQRRGDNEKAN